MRKNRPKIRAFLLFIFLFVPALLLAQWYRDYEGALKKIEDGEYEEALEKIDKALDKEKEPGRKRAQSTRFIYYFPYLVRGKILYYLGRYEEAVAQLEISRSKEEVLQEDHGKREWREYNKRAITEWISQLMDEGIRWFNQGDFEKSRLGFRKVLEAESENDIATLFIKIIDDMQAGDVNKLRLGSKAGYELEQGKKLFAEGRFQEAIIQFSICLALDSTTTEAEVFKKRAELELEQIQKRLTQQASLSKEQQQRQTLMDTLNIGLAAYAEGDFDRAETVLEYVLSRDENIAVANEFLRRTRAEREAAAANTEEDQAIRSEFSQLKTRMDSVNRNSKQKEQTISVLQTLNLGLQAFSSNDYETAARTLEKVLSEDPSLAIAKEYLEKAKTALTEPQTVQVKEEDKKELDSKIGNLQDRLSTISNESREQQRQIALLSRVNNGLRALSRKDYQHAISLFEAVLEENPSMTEAREYLKIAQDAITTSEEDQAIRQESEILRARMDSVSRVSGRRQETVSLLEKLNAGLLAFADNDYPRAVSLLEQVTAEDPSNRKASEYLEKAREASLKPQEAQDDQEKKKLDSELKSLQAQLTAISVESREQNNKIFVLKRMNEGLKALSRKDYERAKALFTMVLQDDPSKTEAQDYLKLAEEAAATADNEVSAQSNIEERIKSELQTGTDLLLFGSYQEALVHFNVVQALDPGNSAALRYAEQAKRDMEKINFQRRLQDEQSPEQAGEKQQRLEQMNKVLVLFSGRKYSEAKETLNSMLETYPGDTQIQDLLTECERGLEREREQRRTEDMLVDYRDGGKRLFNQGDYQEAKDKLVVAAALDPENEEIKALIAQCEIELSAGKATEEGSYFYVSSLQKGMTFLHGTVELDGVAFDKKGLSQVDIIVNGSTIGATKAGDAGTSQEDGKNLAFKHKIRLQEGYNRVVLLSRGVDGRIDSTVIDSVMYYRPRGTIWAALIGVADYLKIPQLHYTVNDVMSIKQMLVEMGVPESNIFTITDAQVTYQSMRKLLGTTLKNRVQPEDQVIVYYSGHGATEADQANNNADNFEKYLLPYDADPYDYYSTSYPMSEVANISQRLNVGQIFFIMDACYSGATGSKSFSQVTSAATYSDDFIQRLSNRAGRVVMTASGPNEPSLEWDHQKHGVFTFYLLQGMAGEADQQYGNRDGKVSIVELNEYISNNVRNTTNDRQHPTFKGNFSGTIYLGKIEGE